MRATIAVAKSVVGTDNALRRYTLSVKAWEAELRSIKGLEEEVGNVMRDRVRTSFPYTARFFFSPTIDSGSA